MANVAELTTAIEEKEAELKDLRADLPKLRRLAAEATAEAANASRTLPLAKRMELHTRRQELAGVANQLEDDIEDTQAAIEELRLELEVAREQERIEQVVGWAKERNAEGARAFAVALKHLEQAQKAFGEAHSTLQLEISKAGGVGSKRGATLLMPTFAFSRVFLQLPPSVGTGSGRQPLERYVERLQQHQAGAFKGR